MSNKVDARGLACPQPVIATKKALDAMQQGVIVTIVDNAVAKENVVKFATSNGCGVSIEEKDGSYHIRITKGEGTIVQGEASNPEGGAHVLLFTKDTLGHGSDELGLVLMKSFFVTLLEASPLPKALYFINGAVKLTVEGSPILDHLRTLLERGVEIQSCGTCLDYYQLKEKLAVGGITNMYTIQADLTSAPKVVTL